MKKALALWAALAVLVPFQGRAYSYFLHYGKDGTAIPEKFNLLQLPLKTVTFYVSNSGPAAYSATDSFPSVLNQIRQAAKVWDGVPASDLRVAFGGLYTEDTVDNSPGGEVVFEDLAPGVLAFSGPTTCEDVTPDGPPECKAQAPKNNEFLPILRSTMHLSRDLTRIPGPSFSETFYLVTVHEMGHALGLQHTFTSSVMSTFATRATSLRQPLDGDDRAGLAALYPKDDSVAGLGSINGKVTYADNDSPVHLATVMAVRSGAPAISALTLPDGSYTIAGIVPGDYFLYAQPLPPTADIRLPRDSSGNEVEPGRPFNAVLYPNARSLSGAKRVTVTAGQSSAGYDWVVTPRSAVPIYDISLFSYFYPDPSTYHGVHPAYVSLNASPALLVASGTGLGTGKSIAPGLHVSALDGSAIVGTVSAYQDQFKNTSLSINLSFSSFGTSGPQHLLFSTADYLYLLPSAFNIVSADPPTIVSSVANGDGTLTVTGNNFDRSTQIYFDALPARVLSRDQGNALIALTPPSGASSQTATLTAYNSDGQNSTFLRFANPPVYSYGVSDLPVVKATPTILPAGAEAMVHLTGTNTHFSQGRTLFGFGSHDVIVRRTFVLSPTHAIVDVGIPEGSAQSTGEVSALSDFEVATASQAFAVQPPQVGLPAAVPILFNAVAGHTGSFPGAIASLYGFNLQASADATPTVLFNGVKATLLYASPNLINLQIPTSLTTGLATVTVNNGSTDSYPVTVSIDLPEPVIVGIQLGPNLPLDGVRSAKAGDLIDILLSGLVDPGTVVSSNRVNVSVGGVDHQAVAVTQVGTSGVYDVQLELSSSVAAGVQVPVIVYIDGRSSAQATIQVTAPTSATN